MPITDYAKNLYTITLETYRLCGDTLPGDERGRIWREAELVDAINRAVLFAMDRAGVLKTTRVIPLQDGVCVYDLPSDCVRLMRVNMHGLEGYVVLPLTVTELDLKGCAMASEGDPLNFYREFLDSDQIGVYPIPSGDGSSFTRDSDYGLLRRITDADGNYVTFDAGRPLRRIRGVPFERTGDGRIIREVISPYGNLVIHYQRAPAMMRKRSDYPDSGIPEWFHKEIKYGAGTHLLRYRRNKLDQARVMRCRRRWLSALLALQRRIEHKGPMDAQSRPI
jgi:hypothetical protein